MKDNPIYSFSKKQIKQYKTTILFYGKRTKQIFKKYRPTVFNQLFLRKWLFKLADRLTEETRTFLLTSIEEVVEKTVIFYNDNHKGEKLSSEKIEELKLSIYKDFVLSKFKGKTLDQRVSQSGKRLKVNLQRELENLIQTENTRSKDINNLILSITGKDYKDGGTAYRWNSRLVLSEIFRAYQYSAKRILEELDVEKVEWKNTERNKDNDLLQELAGEYRLSELPDYPFPCNDSYFVPIY